MFEVANGTSEHLYVPMVTISYNIIIASVIPTLRNNLRLQVAPCTHGAVTIQFTTTLIVPVNYGAVTYKWPRPASSISTTVWSWLRIILSFYGAIYYCANNWNYNPFRVTGGIYLKLWGYFWRVDCEAGVVSATCTEAVYPVQVTSILVN